jgi:hypothetical protein
MVAKTVHPRSDARIRGTHRYSVVRKGSGPGETGEVGVLSVTTFDPETRHFQPSFKVVEFVSADGMWEEWPGLFSDRQGAADYAIAETLKTTHFERTVIKS